MLSRWCLNAVVLWSCDGTAATRTAEPRAREPAPDVVWISIDALRDDHAATPALARLAADGVRCSKLYAHAPSSLPSPVALFASRQMPELDAEHGAPAGIHR